MELRGPGDGGAAVDIPSMVGSVGVTNGFRERPPTPCRRTGGRDGHGYVRATGTSDERARTPSSPSDYSTSHVYVPVLMSDSLLTDMYGGISYVTAVRNVPLTDFHSCTGPIDGFDSLLPCARQEHHEQGPWGDRGYLTAEADQTYQIFRMTGDGRTETDFPKLGL